MIDRFTKEEFEASLPVHPVTREVRWTYAGFNGGEHVYRVKIDSRVFVEVRSSVGEDGISAGTGEDSIRAWLVREDGSPLGSKVSRWTTRQPGWQERLRGVLNTLRDWRKSAGDCPVCGNPKKVFKVKAATSHNKGRVFACCSDHERVSWTWLTDANKK